MEPNSVSGNEARSKRPWYSGQRVTVFEWMLTDCLNVLGPHADDFDLDSWFREIDLYAVREGLIIPKRDGGAWLQAQLVKEAQKRGLPLKFATVDTCEDLMTFRPSKRPYDTE